MSRDEVRRLIFGDQCRWCGHSPHKQECPGHIFTRQDPEAPCPCVKRAN